MAETPLSLGSSSCPSGSPAATAHVLPTLPLPSVLPRGLPAVAQLTRAPSLPTSPRPGLGPGPKAQLLPVPQHCRAFHLFQGRGMCPLPEDGSITDGPRSLSPAAWGRLTSGLRLFFLTDPALGAGPACLAREPCSAPPWSAPAREVAVCCTCWSSPWFLWVPWLVTLPISSHQHSVLVSPQICHPMRTRMALLPPSR